MKTMLNVKNVMHQRKYCPLILNTVSYFFQHLFDFDFKSIIKELCRVSVEYSKDALISSSLTYALISYYTWFTTD